MFSVFRASERVSVGLVSPVRLVKKMHPSDGSDPKPRTPRIQVEVCILWVTPFPDEIISREC